ncbi:MAG: hypothetical protein B6245_00390 [Desulfobacteraceae bacterium 4572_88]|nr:MAG: hypothetical protein B6245_00390 [Desulfobacteraceae bacterium 4572_88]
MPFTPDHQVFFCYSPVFTGRLLLIPNSGGVSESDIRFLHLIIRFFSVIPPVFTGRLLLIPIRKDKKG